MTRVHRDRLKLVPAEKPPAIPAAERESCGLEVGHVVVAVGDCYEHFLEANAGGGPSCCRMCPLGARRRFRYAFDEEPEDIDIAELLEDIRGSTKARRNG